MADGLLKPTGLARCARGGEAGYSDPMASPRVPLILALEVQTGEKARCAQEPPAANPEDGGGESPYGKNTQTIGEAVR